jgi:serine protease AprX
MEVRVIRIRTGTRRVRRTLALGLAVLVSGAASVAAPETASAGLLSDANYLPTDTGTMSAITRIIGAQTAWAAGFTGRGVDVALIDTGVAPVPGLQGGKVVYGPDLSFDAQNQPATAGIDAFGHGTHLAGIIAGRDATARNTIGWCRTCTGLSGYSDATKFVGVAPDARIVSVKVGAYDGSVDVTQMIAAIDWVVQHRNDNGLNIKVLNISYGTPSTQDYRSDLLTYAVEQAWHHGILVVVAGGNDGVATPELSNPAKDPFVLAVGADDPNGTLGTLDDTIPDFATHGSAERPVDVTGPGTHVVSLKVPGSFVDEVAGPEADVGTRFIRGSGTSQSAAVVSGAAALLYQRYPKATPDQIKSLLMTTANRVSTQNILWGGNGIVAVDTALTVPLRLATNHHEPARGDGSLDETRGGDHLVVDGQPLVGEIDIFGHPVDAAALARDTAAGVAWTGGTFNGGVWSGDGWRDGRWVDVRWDRRSWAGTGWDDPTLATAVWDGSRWSGSRWSGSRWSGSRWSGSRWSGSRWSGAHWG